MRHFTFLPLILLVGCTLFDDPRSLHDESQDPSLRADASLIPGSWQWVSSAGYNTLTGRPHVETAEESGRSEKLVFDPDGSVLRFVNGEQDREGTFEIDKEKRRISVFGISGTYGVNEETHVLNYSETDLPVKVYKRIRE